MTGWRFAPRRPVPLRGSGQRACGPSGSKGSVTHSAGALMLPGGAGGEAGFGALKATAVVQNTVVVQNKDGAVLRFVLP
ncbi:hypothetical protein ACH4PW_36735 [Streptomyces sp. NPDC017082]|uniref:hypothetical protein n=1 Tax=Streptomyces sp. NPDC017082 TaxID=3364974 RepID=UPI0037B163A4